MTMDRMLTPITRVKDRLELLHRMPKGGVVVEVGAELGFYSKFIEQIVRPERLYLVDTWDPDVATDVVIDGIGIPEPIFGDEALRRVKRKFNQGIIDDTVRIIEDEHIAGMK